MLLWKPVSTLFCIWKQVCCSLLGNGKLCQTGSALHIIMPRMSHAKDQIKVKDFSVAYFANRSCETDQIVVSSITYLKNWAYEKEPCLSHMPNWTDYLPLGKAYQRGFSTLLNEFDLNQYLCYHQEQSASSIHLLRTSQPAQFVCMSVALHHWTSFAGLKIKGQLVFWARRYHIVDA